MGLFKKKNAQLDRNSSSKSPNKQGQEETKQEEINEDVTSKPNEVQDDSQQIVKEASQGEASQKQEDPQQDTSAKRISEIQEQPQKKLGGTKIRSKVKAQPKDDKKGKNAKKQQDKKKKDAKKKQAKKNAVNSSEKLQEKEQLEQVDQEQTDQGAASTMNETAQKDGALSRPQRISTQGSQDQDLGMEMRDTVGNSISPDKIGQSDKGYTRHTMGAIVTPSTSYPETPAGQNSPQKLTVKTKMDRTSEIVKSRDTFPINEVQSQEITDQGLSPEFENKVHKFSDGSTYRGDMKYSYKSNRHGQEKILIQHGVGALTLSNGQTLEGNWRDGILNEGSLLYPNGNMYVGEFTALSPNGYGEMTKSNGTTLKGNWVNGEINKGCEITEQGEIYSGTFINNKRHGQGELVLPNKNVLKGQWECGELKGEATMIRPNGQRVDGETNIDQIELNVGENNELQDDNQENSYDPLKAHQKNFYDKSNVIQKVKSSKEDERLKQEAQDLENFKQDHGDGEMLNLICDNVQYKGQVPGGIIEEQKRLYKHNCRKLKREQDNDKWSLTNLEKRFHEEPIYATKYNHNLEGSIMNHYQSECRIELSEDCSRLNIYNRKLNTKPAYHYEITPDEIVQEKKLMNEAKKNGEEYVPVIKEYPDDYSWVLSSASCNIDDIQGIIYGGSSSRFWIFRKHMLSLDSSEIIKDKQVPNYNPKYENGYPEELPLKTSFPFFAWQCITLQFETRNLDLVIKDDDEMMRFIKFLVPACKTVDGIKGTAEFMINSSTHYKIEATEKKMNKKIQKKRDSIPLESDEEYDDTLQLQSLNEEQREEIRLKQEKEIYRQTSFKYLMMRIRTKIGYHAFRKQMTVNEFLIQGIARSYKTLIEEAEIPVCAPYSKESFQLFNDILDAPMTSTIIGLMELAHDPVLRKRKEQIYMQKEFKTLGINGMDDLDDYNRRGLELLFEKNIGDDDDENGDCEHSDMLKIEKRQLMQTGLTFKTAHKRPDLFSFTDKSKCADIYLRTMIEKDKNTLINMYEQRSYRVLLKYKWNKMKLQNKLNKIKFLIGVGELVDIFYIKAVLLKKSLVKQMFVLDIEHNQEIYIPDLLSVDMYPYSFRYYDPIITITNRLFDKKQKMYHCLKTEFFLKKLQGKDFKKKFFERTGILPNEKKMPQQFMHAQMKEIGNIHIKITQTKHHISLQKSRYMMIESTEEGLKKLANLQTYVIEKKKDTEPGERKFKPLEDQQLEIRFCQQQEVQEKRQKFIIFKMKQFVRHDFLKNNGQKLFTTRLLELDITNNFDKYYAQRPRDKEFFKRYNKEKQAEMNLDLIPFRKLTGRQKNMLERDRKQYEEFIIRYSENLVQKRRANIRLKCVDEAYTQCGPRVPFEQKNFYIESKIESTYGYFNNLDDMAHVGQENIEKFRKQLRMVDKEIARQQQKKMENLPQAVMNKMSKKNLDIYLGSKGYKTDMKQKSMQNIEDIIQEQNDLDEKTLQMRSLKLQGVEAIAGSPIGSSARKNHLDGAMSVEKSFVREQLAG